MDNGRNGNGRFATGNAGGPGRPPRALERDYLAALCDAVSLDDWRTVVARALEDAKSGDAKARDWLAKYLLGNEPPSLGQAACESPDERRSRLAALTARLRALDGGQADDR